MSDPQDANETLFDKNSQEASDDTLSVERKRVNSPRVFNPLLLCLEGPHRGMRFPLQKREQVIGRSSQADIQIDDEMISRRHVLITWHNWQNPSEFPHCTCEDLGSRNGTELNGAPLVAPAVLRERDRLLLGSTVLGFFLRDADEIELDRTLYELATKDALTGLDNRHQFNALLRHYIERVRRYGQKIALLLVDADHFKVVNDTHGHDVGDLALQHIARIIATSCRSTEVCSRWGGEEFAILAPESDQHGATVLAERIRTRIALFPLEINSRQKLGLSVSIGITMLRPEDSPEETFRRADRSLYLAKELGRNKTVFDGRVVGLDQMPTFAKRPPLAPEG
ncbi:MAG: diguanylate cyclase [Candidatus Sumerlaeaceae bacterium]|jgi:diguanylate cyclase (GGDEF)-like protein